MHDAILNRWVYVAIVRYVLRCQEEGDEGKRKTGKGTTQNRLDVRVI